MSTAHETPRPAWVGGSWRRPVPAWEWLYCAVLVAICVYWARGYYATVPRKAFQLVMVLSAYAFAFCWLGFYRLPRIPDRAKGLWRVVQLVFWAGFARPVVFLILSGGGFLFVISNVAGITLAACELLLLAALLVAAWRGKMRWLTFRYVFATGVFLNALLHIWVSIGIWSPPSLETCEESVSPWVERVTPQSVSDALSQTYSLMVVPEKHLLAASFKMAGNLIFDPWNDPNANRTLLFDLAADEPGPDGMPYPYLAIERPGMETPLYFTYAAEQEELIMTTLAYDGGHIDIVDLSDWPQSAEMVRSIPTDYAPSRGFYVPEQRALVVLGLFGEYIVYDYDTMEIRRRAPINPVKDVLVTGGRAVPDRPEVLIAGMGFAFYRVNWLTGVVDAVPLEFSLGDMILEPYVLTAYEGDFVLRAINVIDVTTMTALDRVAVDYPPRGFEVDRARDLLVVGEWFGGDIHTYSAETMRERLPPLRIGPYIRALALDPAGGDLFVGSKCGVYRVDIDGLLAQHEGAPPARE